MHMVHLATYSGEHALLHAPLHALDSMYASDSYVHLARFCRQCTPYWAEQNISR